MIQAANVGVGIVGKEGRQASLAADFSITQFSHVTSLFLVRHFIIALDLNFKDFNDFGTSLGICLLF